MSLQRPLGSGSIRLVVIYSTSAKTHTLLLLLLSRFSHVQLLTRLPCPCDSPRKNTGVGCHVLLQCMKVKSESEVTQSCLTLCYPMDCSLPGSSVHGIFQARVLEWVAIAFSTCILQNDLSRDFQNYTQNVALGLTSEFQFSSVTQPCPTFCDPMNCSMPGFPVHHQLPELAHTHVH